jgi:predicted ribosome quality control (RQC) complex YloA/Tae2 family protein
MRTLSNLEYTYLCKELQSLVGRRLDKFYDLGEGRFRMKFGDADIICELGKRMNITKYIEKSPETPSGFAMSVRKELEARKLASVSQHGFDRVVVFMFEGSPSMVFEMFGKGNLVLVQGGKTKKCFKREEWKDRKTLPGTEYGFPAPAKVAQTPSVPEIKGLLSDKFAASSLSAVPLGSVYVKEALARAKVPEKKKGSELSDAETKLIAEEIERIVRNAKPMGYAKAGRIEEFSLCALSGYCGHEIIEDRSLNELADEYFHQHAGEAGAAQASGEQAQRKKQVEKLEKRLAMQRAEIAQFEKSAEEAKAAGDAIYAHYEKIDAMLAKVRELKKAGAPDSEITAALAKLGARYDGKKGKVELEA